MKQKETGALHKLKNHMSEKTHECDGGSDYGHVDCFGCEKEMLKNFGNAARQYGKRSIRTKL